MKRIMLFFLTCLMAGALVLTGCAPSVIDGGDGGGSGNSNLIDLSKVNPTTLTENTWANGSIPTSNGEQWFKFTATASTQFIHASLGTLDGLSAYLYDSSGAAVEEMRALYNNSFVSRSLTVGKEYYIRVRPYGYGSGTFRILFNITLLSPDVTTTTLTANVWADGNLPTSDSEQWFKFTATASTQFIHAGRGTLSDVFTYVYDSSGVEVVEGASGGLISMNVTAGQEYYIRVRPSVWSGGTYRITFNTTLLPPGATAIALTTNVWADGNIPTENDEQWFKFTATASTQFIHASLGTLTNYSIRVYDSSGAAVEEMSALYNNSFVSRSLTVGKEYYIRVQTYPSSGGTYRITLNTALLPPGTTVTTLTANVWADGNLPTDKDVQWFRFTATASTQSIHFNSGRGVEFYVYVYDSSGAEVSRFESLANNRFGYLSVIVGQEYYIYIRVNYRYGDGSVTYKIAFNTTFYSPGVTTLTANVWADGNLPTGNDRQWFKFTATASTQWIHFSPDTGSNLYVGVYDSSGAAVRWGTGGDPLSVTVTVGQEYYISVSGNSNVEGTYRILFNATILPPGATASTLTANVWADGNIPTYYDEQWFKFTATASTQFIHVRHGTLTGFEVRVYDSGGATVGNLYNVSSKLVSPLSVTVGQEYYIRVWPNGSGTYRIAFNASETAP